jgi:uncharacterized protein (DUF1501 family)
MSMKSTSRRDFLRQSAASAAGAVAMGVLPQFGMLNSALAQSTISGYKALVCLYMSGGNDGFNMLIPTNAARHAEYVTARGGLFTGNASALAIPRIGGLTPGGSLPPALPLAGVEFGLNPACTGMQNLYNQGRLAFISNVAPLVEPVTRATYDARRLPPQLYSHTDQTLLWNIGNSSSSTSTEGWGGLVAGRINATSSLAGLPPSISLAGQPRFLVGNRPSTGAPIKPYNISTSSSKPAPTPNGLSATSTNNFESLRRQTVNQLLAAASPNALTNEYGDVLERSYLVGASVNALIGTGGIYNPLPAGTVFPATTLGNQFAQIVRMINASKNSPLVQANRQVYYVDISGWDSHSGQIPSASPNAAGVWDGHQGLLQNVSNCIETFYRAMATLRMHNEVILFSAGDFGRTISSNGDGTDHGWGGVQFIVGGGLGNNAAVTNDTGGGALLARNPQTGTGNGMYGRFPRISRDQSDSAAIPDAEKGECLSGGRYIPTTSSEQMSASLARWMGVDDANIPLIFPNVDRYNDFTVAQGNLMAYTGRYVPMLQGIA